MTRTITLPIKCSTVKKGYSTLLDLAGWGLVLWTISGWVSLAILLVFFTDATGHGTYPTTGIWNQIIYIMVVGGSVVGSLLTFKLTTPPNLNKRVTIPVAIIVFVISRPFAWIYNNFPRIRCIKDDEEQQP